MAQDSQQFKEAVNLAILTVLNVQVMSITAQNVFQASQLTQEQENVLQRLAALTVKNTSKELVLPFVTMASTSTKESVFTEDVSMDMLLMLMEVALDQLQFLQDLLATSTNTFKMDNVLEPAEINTTLTQQLKNVLPVPLTVTLASAVHSVSSVQLDTKWLKENASKQHLAMPTNSNTKETV